MVFTKGLPGLLTIPQKLDGIEINVHGEMEKVWVDVFLNAREMYPMVINAALRH